MNQTDQNKGPAGAKPAQQARSRETTRAIAAALEELLKSKNFEQITMVEIAKGAKVSPGAIYRRFENKEALLPHVFDRYREELGKWLARVTPEFVLSQETTLEGALRVVIEETLRCFRDQAHIFRTVHLFARLRAQSVKAGSPTNASFEPFGSLLKTFKSEILKPPQDAAAFLGHSLIANVNERALYPAQLPAAGLNISDEQFASDLAKMYAAWLRA